MPVLDCAFQVLFEFYVQKIEIILLTNQDPIHVWSGGLDNILKSFDINSSTESAHGSHEGAIKCVEFSGECGLVVTGSWDSTVMLLLENLDAFESVVILLGGTWWKYIQGMQLYIEHQ